MNDKDFQEIGRRLYDQEAEPPRDGWKKISAGIRSPKLPAKFAWLRKNFWIPLALMLPAAFYFYQGETSRQDFKITPSLSADTATHQIAQGSPAVQTPDNTAHNNLNSPATSPADVEQDMQLKSERQDGRSSITITQPQRRSDGTLRESSESTTQTNPLITTDQHSDDVIEITDVRKGIAQIEEDAQTRTIATGANESLTLNSPVSVDGEENNQKESTPSSLAAAHTNKDILITAQEKELANDSVSTVTTVKEVEAKKKYGHWRINASFTPYYVTRSVRPIVNDEVFVTDIDDVDDKFIDRINLGFALGAGMAITERVFVDAQLSFSQSEQNTFYSYSTGNVDTLLAIQQEDQSIRLIPVYQETDRESKSKYTYGGIRFGATYYFLSTSQGRFNIAAAAGVNYLLSSTVKEKIDGQWITLSNDDLNKLNYSIMAGAGYSMTFSKGWELMINPSLTYNLRQVKNNQLPYQLNQRPFGLNVMLSKTLGGM